MCHTPIGASSSEIRDVMEMSSSGALAAIKPTPALRGGSLGFSIGIEGVNMIRIWMDSEGVACSCAIAALSHFGGSQPAR